MICVIKEPLVVDVKLLNQKLPTIQPLSRRYYCSKINIFRPCMWTAATLPSHHLTLKGFLNNYDLCTSHMFCTKPELSNLSFYIITVVNFRLFISSTSLIIACYTPKKKCSVILYYLNTSCVSTNFFFVLFI